METICTFFLNYQQYIILLTICFFAGMAWRHHRLISRLFIIAASCLWVIYVYRYQIAVGWPALDASGELSLRELFSDGAFIRQKCSDRRRWDVAAQYFFDHIFLDRCGQS